MGSTDADKDAADDERPQHTVYLDEFLIGTHEVTVAQFRAFVHATSHRTSAEATGWAGPGVAANGSRSKARTGSILVSLQRSALQGRSPVTQVSWDDAVAFCRWPVGSASARCACPRRRNGKRRRAGVMAVFTLGGTVGTPAAATQGRRARGTRRQWAAILPGQPLWRPGHGGECLEWVQDWYAADYYRSSPARNPTDPRGATTGWCAAVLLLLCGARPLRVSRLYYPSSGATTSGFGWWSPMSSGLCISGLWHSESGDGVVGKGTPFPEAAPSVTRVRTAVRTASLAASPGGLGLLGLLSMEGVSGQVEPLHGRSARARARAAAWPRHPMGARCANRPPNCGCHKAQKKRPSCSSSSSLTSRYPHSPITNRSSATAHRRPSASPGGEGLRIIETEGEA